MNMKSCALKTVLFGFFTTLALADVIPCTGTLPCFHVDLVVPASPPHQFAATEASYQDVVPIGTQNLSGNDAAYTSGSATGWSRLGGLGAGITLTTSSPYGVVNAAKSEAQVSYTDFFTINSFAAGQHFVLTFTVTGSVSQAGMVTASETAGAALEYADDESRFTNSFLNGPGTFQLDMPLIRLGANPLRLGITMDLQAQTVNARVPGGPGSAIVDFLGHSADLTGAELFDSTGHSLGAIPLVDNAGFTVLDQTASSPVPEPATMGLCMLAIVALALLVTTRSRIFPPLSPTMPTPRPGIAL